MQRYTRLLTNSPFPPPSLNTFSLPTTTNTDQPPGHKAVTVPHKLPCMRQPPFLTNSPSLFPTTNFPPHPPPAPSTGLLVTL